MPVTLPGVYLMSPAGLLEGASFLVPEVDDLVAGNALGADFGIPVRTPGVYLIVLSVGGLYGCKPALEPVVEWDLGAPAGLDAIDFVADGFDATLVFLVVVVAGLEFDRGSPFGRDATPPAVDFVFVNAELAGCPLILLPQPSNRAATPVFM
jgi:hypothetical protein